MMAPAPSPVLPVRGADRTPEDRGLARDGVRLLVSGPDGDRHHRFRDLPDLLAAGDTLVVNESATIAASVPARAGPTSFVVSASTEYGPDLWLVETRWGPGAPGPVPLRPGDRFEIGEVPSRYLRDYPGIPRLAFVHTEGDLRAAMTEVGRPIRYGYLARDYPLETYQTVFSRVPGSAEMPSAARPFTPHLVERLRSKGIGVARVVLHAGVSSLEMGDAGPNRVPVFPEPFDVPIETVTAIRRTHERGGRVIAVGTTVVRALESAADDCGLRPARGFTRLYLHPGRPTRTVDGILTGFHEGTSTHLALLGAVVGSGRIERAYRVAAEGRYLWHEFGDSHLILRGGRPSPSAGGGPSYFDATGRPARARSAW